MDNTLANIVRGAGLKFRLQYDLSDAERDPVVFKFMLDENVDPTSPGSKSIIQKIISELNAIKFVHLQVAFEKHQRARGEDYWAVVIRRPSLVKERPLDRDIHGNLIYRTSQRRAA
jgi:hypothetical protein